MQLEDNVFSSPALDLNFDQYDFYNMTNEDMHDLLKELNLELGRTLLETTDKVQETFAISVDDLGQDVANGLSDVNKNLETLTIQLSESFDGVDKLNENLSNMYFIGLALLVGVGLVAGLLSGIFATRFMR
ncbi:MAG: hypothetical protein RHS_2440 [Robinsoniella sp. RHS]|nr:MAG: hypothetical protein RHS_2440 [Robinsoniella sp. RHS]